MGSSIRLGRAIDEKPEEPSVSRAPVDDETKVDGTGIGTNFMKESFPDPAPGESLEHWNRPRINIYRYLATLWSFILMGMNDAAIGVSSPPLIPDMHLIHRPVC